MGAHRPQFGVPGRHETAFGRREERPRARAHASSGPLDRRAKAVVVDFRAFTEFTSTGRPASPHTTTRATLLAPKQPPTTATCSFGASRAREPIRAAPERRRSRRTRALRPPPGLLLRSRDRARSKPCRLCLAKAAARFAGSVPRASKRRWPPRFARYCFPFGFGELGFLPLELPAPFAPPTIQVSLEVLRGPSTRKSASSRATVP